MTNEITWHALAFDQLSNNQLYDALKLRIDVFVVEQTCYYPDLDDCDRHADTIHLLGYDNLTGKGDIVAYARILPKGLTYANYNSIGRVAIAAKARGAGLGHTLMTQAINTCLTYFPKQDIKISAQQHLEKYYNQHHFEKASDCYLEDGIPHIAMIRKYSG